MRSLPSTASPASTPTSSAKADAASSPSWQLREAPRRRLDSLMALIDDFDREIAQTTREIEQRAKADDRVEVLTQIRGVGRYTAMLIIAEVGRDRPLPRCPPPVRLGRTHQRIAKRRGRKVAVARHVLTLSYYGLSDGEIRCLARRSRASAKEKLAAA